MSVKRLYRVTDAMGCHVFHYQTLRAAEHRRAVLAAAAIPASIEVSDPITWPIPPITR